MRCPEVRLLETGADGRLRPKKKNGGRLLAARSGAATLPLVLRFDYLPWVARLLRLRRLAACVTDSCASLAKPRFRLNIPSYPVCCVQDCGIFLFYPVRDCCQKRTAGLLSSKLEERASVLLVPLH